MWLEQRKEIVVALSRTLSLSECKPFGWLSDIAPDSAYYKWKTVCHALVFALTSTITEYPRRRYFVSTNSFRGHS